MPDNVCACCLEQKFWIEKPPPAASRALAAKTVHVVHVARSIKKINFRPSPCRSLLNTSRAIDPVIFVF